MLKNIYIKKTQIVNSPTCIHWFIIRVKLFVKTYFIYIYISQRNQLKSIDLIVIFVGILIIILVIRVDGLPRLLRITKDRQLLVRMFVVQIFILCVCVCDTWNDKKRERIYCGVVRSLFVARMSKIDRIWSLEVTWNIIPSVCTLISTCIRKSMAMKAAVTIIGSVTRDFHANLARKMNVRENGVHGK